ncbi:MAG TPA: A/G-specific adenine glycosylase [Acidimicrobiales bacterium]|nr:A/G-specific adenine glycosylase [Acidimicrobiales bacterium]
MHDPLLSWYSSAGRHDLPWRQTRDPWAVLVSELMLQQTQVPRVLPKYLAFMRRFPSAGACAAAPVGEVVRAWAGLGYNRRAVNLHRTAVAVVADHAGSLPSSLPALLALPGIGPYTARAVLAFAHEQAVCPLDVNTARPLARAWSVTSQDAADALVPAVRAWDWNQALMDLGALVCTRRSPDCASCPVAAVCQWRLHGGPDPAAPAGRQSRFAGSDRQGRGRLVDALRDGPVPGPALAEAMGWPADPTRAVRVAATLVADGLAERLPDGSFTLPD